MVCHCCPCGAGRSIGCLDDLDDAFSYARGMADSQVNMTPECLVCWRIFEQAGDVTEDRIPTVFYEIRYRAKTGARCDLGVPDVVLTTDPGYLALALHVESLQASFIGSD